jgi:hypothetical protein
MTFELQQAFEAIGVQMHVETRGRVFEIDVREHAGRERYELRYPHGDVMTAEALDVKPRERHLVLDVTGWRLPISGRYLCGHDEMHWFVAALPFQRKTETVRGAMEALKPAVVQREQKRKGVKHRRNRRKTAAYVRQGEWFFLPRPRMQVDEQFVEHHAQLARPGGKPHRVEQLYRTLDGDLTFVRGDVSHTDHRTLHLEVWHRVVQNSEAEPAQVQQRFVRMAYVD